MVKNDSETNEIVERGTRVRRILDLTKCKTEQEVERTKERVVGWYTIDETKVRTKDTRTKLRRERSLCETRRTTSLQRNNKLSDKDLNYRKKQETIKKRDVTLGATLTNRTNPTSQVEVEIRDHAMTKRNLI